MGGNFVLQDGVENSMHEDTHKDEDHDNIEVAQLATEDAEGDAVSQAQMQDASDKEQEQQDSVEDASSFYSEYEDVDELIDDRYKWYIVNTFAGSEDSAKLNLLDRIKRFSGEDFFRGIVIPKVTVDRLLKSGERKKTEKTSFPGYMFVQMDLTDAAMAIVVNTPRVMGFLGNHKYPKPMDDKDVLRLLGTLKEEEKQHMEEVLQGITFEKNQAIRVTDGPFTNFDGIVDEVRADKMKLKVLVSILGRETPVELSYNQVEKVDE